MRFSAFKFRPSSHSDDFTLIATYRNDKAAKRVKDALLKMLKDMEKNPDDYDTDWMPDDAGVASDGEKVYFEVYTAGYLECVEALLNKVAKPLNIEYYRDYQELEISVKVPKGLTPEIAQLVLGREEAEAIKWLTETCGRPEVEDCDDGEHQLFRWSYRGDGIYSDGALFIGFEFPVDEYENWSVEE